MIWICQEGDRLRNGLNIGWRGTGPTVIVSWTTRARIYRLRMRLRTSFNYSLILHWQRGSYTGEVFAVTQEWYWSWLICSTIRATK